MTRNYAIQSQRDKSVAGLWMNNNQRYPVGEYGCLLTCMAMIADYPVRRVNYLWMAYAQYEIGSAKWNKFAPDEWTCGRFDYYGQTGWYPYIPMPDADIKKGVDWFNAGRHIVLEVDFYPSDSINPNFPQKPQEQQHFVLMSGVDGDVITIIDPWDGGEKYLCPRYGKTNSAALIRAIAFQEVKA